MDQDGQQEIAVLLNAIESDKTDARLRGLLDLRKLLVQYHNKISFSQIDDKGYHAVLETVFRAAKADSLAYALAAKSAKSKVATRLSACGALFRAVINVGVSKIRQRTVLAVVGHVQQTLSTPEGEYCGPLYQDYCKGLKVLLEFKPHLEHFESPEWSHLVDFLLRSLSDINGSVSKAGRAVYTDSRSGDPTFSPNNSESPNNNSSEGSASSTFRQLQGSVDTIVQCLLQLTLAGEGWLRTRIEPIFQTVIDLLNTYPQLGKIQANLFAIVSTVLASAIVENISLAEEIVRSMIGPMSSAWDRASRYQRTTILGILIRSQCLMRKILSSTHAEEFHLKLGSLLEVMIAQYTNRQSKDGLNLDDISVVWPEAPETKPPLSIEGMALSAAGSNAEEPWCIARMCAFMQLVVEEYEQSTTNLSHEFVRDSLNPKRRKFAHVSTPITGRFDTADRSVSVPHLQVMAFYFDLKRLEPDVLRFHLKKLVSLFSEATKLAASWRFLTLVCLAHQRVATSSLLQGLWDEAWRIGVQYLASSTVCRLASHLLATLLERKLVSTHSVREAVDSLFISADLHNPMYCDDASLRFFYTLLKPEWAERLGLTELHRRSVLRWVCKKWDPEKVDDRGAPSNSARFASPDKILIVFLSCFGIWPHLRNLKPFPLDGRLSLLELTYKRSMNLHQFLLGHKLESVPSFDARQSHSSTSITDHHIAYAGEASELAVMLDDYLHQQATGIANNLVENANTLPGNCNNDFMLATLQFLLVGYGMVHALRRSFTGYLEKTEGLLDQVILQYRSSLIQHEKAKELIDTVLDNLGVLLGPLHQLDENTTPINQAAVSVARRLDFELKSSSLAAGQPGIPADEVELESDEFGISQEGPFGNDLNKNDVYHDTLRYENGKESYRASVACKIRLLGEVGRSPNDEGPVTLTSQSVISYLTSLTGEDFLLSGSFLQEWTKSSAKISEDDADTLLQYFQLVILSNYELERSTISLSLLIKLLENLGDIWVTSEHDDLAITSLEVYDCLMKEVIDKSCPSDSVLSELAIMLQAVINQLPTYPESSHVASAKSKLLQLFGESSVFVKSTMDGQIAHVFKAFSIEEHQELLEDIVEYLPRNPTEIEGIGMRIRIFGTLAATWPSLRRRCLYGIFETAGRIPTSTKSAALALSELANRLALVSQQDLLHLFGPQMLYTWLESQSIESIPHQIFGYLSLMDFLLDLQQEIVGQVIMRGKVDEYQELQQIFNTQFVDLLVISFSKAAAYCIARDIAVPPNDASRAPQAESRLRKALGNERYSQLLVENFPLIVVELFRSADQDDQFAKALYTNPTFAGSIRNLEAMSTPGIKRLILPPARQPSFKSKYLLAELEHLCNRTSMNFRQMWSPSLFVFVLRSLISELHPVLGSLTACSVLRKIRNLISVSEPSATQGYPLEMALHAVRPFLDDATCTEDATSIAKFLISHGTESLKERPSFFLGIGLKTILTIQHFLRSKCPEYGMRSRLALSQKIARQFREWLLDYLYQFRSPQLSHAAGKAFVVFCKTASDVEANGSAIEGTPESKLLIAMLDDHAMGHQLLPISTQQYLLKVMSESFEMPQTFRDDALGDDETAAKHFSAIWSTFKSDSTSSEYQLWCGRVIGRALASGRNETSEHMREISFDLMQSDDYSDEAKFPLSSRVHLLRLVVSELWGEDRRQAASAEAHLTQIVSKSSRDSNATAIAECIEPAMLEALRWNQPLCPISNNGTKPVADSSGDIHGYSYPDAEYRNGSLLETFCKDLANASGTDPLFNAYGCLIRDICGLASKAFPFLLHAVLSMGSPNALETKAKISRVFQNAFSDSNQFPVNTSLVRNFLKALLYLWTQKVHGETVMADRLKWLDLDYQQAANAANKCSMPKTALFLLELDVSERLRSAATSRRRPKERASIEEVPKNTLLSIFRNLNEEDGFYGIQQPSSLEALMTQFQYEHRGSQGLFLSSAFVDSGFRQPNSSMNSSLEALAQSLQDLELNGLSISFFEGSTWQKLPSKNSDSAVRAARALEKWDLSIPRPTDSEEYTLFRVLRELNKASTTDDVRIALDAAFADLMQLAGSSYSDQSKVRNSMRSLAILSEIEDLCKSRGPEEAEEVRKKFDFRSGARKVHGDRFFKDIISSRQIVFSSIRRSARLRAIMDLTQKQACLLEAKNLLGASLLHRERGNLQSALTTVAHLNQLVQFFSDSNVEVLAATRNEVADLMWGQGQTETSIRMLSDLVRDLEANAFAPQSISVGKSGILARLGQRTAEARFQKADDIIQNILKVAIRELDGKTAGDEAGDVFHEFAHFCDMQLQNPEALADFERIRKLRRRKKGEVEDLEKMMAAVNVSSKERDALKSHRNRAKQWFDLDDREFQRLGQSRLKHLQYCLENYLQCLRACDKHDTDALRFSTLWLQNGGSEEANQSVSKYLAQVPSRKFVPLINPWTSRLQNDASKLASLLASAVYRICVEHPYHGMYQIFASSKTKGGKDDFAMARFAAANKIVENLKNNHAVQKIWLALHNTNVTFVRFAAERLADQSIKPGAKVLLKHTAIGLRVEQDVLKLRVPPPTINLEVRADLDYSRVTIIEKFMPEFTVASGISMPKILTAIGDDGQRYKQLFKGGNDDLRQDAIMEQVFATVSSLLQVHAATRSRRLKIRTYTVRPLTATAGIIEFVQDTIPLHDYLLPAHQRYYSRDLKPSVCRKYIQDAQNTSTQNRVKVFRKICEQFHPVMRYFFQERCAFPEEWFDFRLSYVRSTAAISILGHILGLGDRHGHNILLDEKTGEVVHIDLGIAFEQGRILPVPEMVPFRLTRDLVDGMGITGTEGVFRRCCEFTLEALRSEVDTIMTVLDILRYDPLYSWSLSPLRLKRMQEQQANGASSPPGLADAGAGISREAEDDTGEAERALLIVTRKLSKTLSVQATVNELIQQATDDSNLALLFCGWAAYV